MTRAEARSLERAARYCRVLAAVERALALPDYREAERLVAGIDPIDCQFTAAELETQRHLPLRLLKSGAEVTGPPAPESPAEVELLAVAHAVDRVVDLCRVEVTPESRRV